jgi:CRP/FNR family transcriptional regulator
MTEAFRLLKENFPELQEASLLDDILQHSRYRNVKAGDKIIDFGSHIKSIPLLLQGSVQVLREGADGREIFLYYLLPGETCAMSLSCCMVQEASQVKAIAEEDSSMLLLPVSLMDSWMLKYVSWKNLVMNTYRKRFDELLHTIDNIAFKSMDERLWSYLLDTSSALNSHVIPTTHQEVAYALNSTREVISRLLKQLEKQGKIRLERNRITLIH